ncbi:HIRAN domain-containing protein [Paenibacillus sp. J2TS4]|uniref:HIRAN domain-containing protein n=1 Tax=Paenibacillus sp. J2TS4 TaxID=2807194 RepID=UPI001B1910C1|nr:HIRAN domain-containing protein [Paenibacillus sp. J2TS4]GIP31640.1 hypothetical protein J2TS4_08500 [Paenibacillus sp. J2TS4]
MTSLHIVDSHVQFLYVFIPADHQEEEVIFQILIVMFHSGLRTMEVCDLAPGDCHCKDRVDGNKNDYIPLWSKGYLLTIKRIAVARTLKAGDRLIIKRDPRNEYDPYAIQVWAENNQLGFVPRDLGYQGLTSESTRFLLVVDSLSKGINVDRTLICESFDQFNPFLDEVTCFCA